MPQINVIDQLTDSNMRRATSIVRCRKEAQRHLNLLYAYHLSSTGMDYFNITPTKWTVLLG